MLYRQRNHEQPWRITILKTKRKRRSFYFIYFFMQKQCGFIKDTVCLENGTNIFGTLYSVIYITVYKRTFFS